MSSGRSSRRGPEVPRSRLALLGAIARRHRRAAVLLVHGLVAGLSWTLAFALRFNLDALGTAHRAWLPWWRETIAAVVLVRLVMFGATGLHRASWRFAAARDAMSLAGAVAAGSLVVAGGLLVLRAGPFPYSVIAFDAALCLLMCAAAHFARRIADEALSAWELRRARRVLVVGAGSAGSLTIRALQARGRSDYHPVAILDDDPLRQGTTLHGVPVAGPVDDVAAVAARTGAAAIVLAVPSASSSQLYRIVNLCRTTGLPLKTIPDLWQILRSSEVVGRITDFRVEDLLDRRPIRSDVAQIRDLLSGRRVLVTGAAGSIGSELCRQIAEQPADCLICLDRDESGLFRLEHELRAQGTQVPLVFFLGDIRERARMQTLFERHRPAVVFHAAAYKHVPCCSTTRSRRSATTSAARARWWTSPTPTRSRPSS